VEGFAFALERVALEKLLRVGTVFRNHASKVAAIHDGEYGLSLMVRTEGWQMDTLLSSYQGVDWANKQNWHCNGYAFPSRENSYFGMSMHPFETIFHKSHWTKADIVNMRAETLLTEWQDGSHDDKVARASFFEPAAGSTSGD